MVSLVSTDASVCRARGRVELGLLVRQFLVGSVSLCFLCGVAAVFSGGFSAWGFFGGGVGPSLRVPQWQRVGA